MKTIQEMISECLEQLESKKSPNTVKTYRDGFEVFVQYLYDTTGSITEITPQHFIDFPAWLVSKYTSKRSAMNREAAAKYLRTWLVHKRYLVWDYANDADYEFAKKDAFSEREYPLPKVIPEADIVKAIEYVSTMDTFYPIERTRNVALIYLMASSGIRVTEVASLKVADIKLTELKVYVRKAKGKKSFFSPISGKAAEAIEAYWLERGWSADDDPAFARHDKKNGDKHTSVSAQGIQFMMRELREQAGIPDLTAHKFRHYVGTKVAKEFGLQTASQWLHHSSMETTKGYSHLLDQDIMDAAKKMYGD